MVKINKMYLGQHFFVNVQQPNSNRNWLFQLGFDLPKSSCLIHLQGWWYISVVVVWTLGYDSSKEISQDVILAFSHELLIRQLLMSRPWLKWTAFRWDPRVRPWAVLRFWFYKIDRSLFITIWLSSHSVFTTFWLHTYDLIIENKCD